MVFKLILEISSLNEAEIDLFTKWFRAFLYDTINSIYY